MIIVTGAAGFIGSCIVKELNNRGISDIIVVDELESSEKWKNLVNLKYTDFIHKNDFFEELPLLKNVDLIIHMGACSSTTEKNADFLMENNFIFSKKIYNFCLKNSCRLIYASSAATYGDGSLGYDDSKTDELMPLNMYGYTKKLFDHYILNSKKLIQCVGLRFFNVYGANEYHKGSMASVVFHAFNQIKKDGKVKLFKSYKKEFKQGEQERDFVYVKDAVDVVMFMMQNKNISGIFNVGTGKARTFNDLVVSVFNALKTKPNIEYIEMPQDLREKYQYFTEADMKKLRKAGYIKEFFSLEEGVKDYVCNYLDKNFANY